MASFFNEKTKRFVVKSHQSSSGIKTDTINILCDLNCDYSQNILLKSILKRPWCNIIYNLPEKENGEIIQFRDFENIEWDNVMKGSQRASSYLVRKGLSRKAQLCMQLKKYFSKNPSTYKAHFPYTLIIQTWNAFDDMKIDFGGGVISSFDSSHFTSIPFRQRLEWTLEDIYEDFHHNDRKEWLWILKPSVTNKGSDVSVIRTWEDLLDNLERTPDIREWVLQKYIDNPLLILNGHKFHFRVYVLCVGALKVYMYDNILMLLAAHKYDTTNLSDIYAHLTNTARNAELIDFDETQYVKMLDDLPHYIQTEYPYLYNRHNCNSKEVISHIIDQISGLISTLFTAYENEYTIFAPLSNCFEWYGLDFMIDDHLIVHFLEANPGPDFKQTGDTLKDIIAQFFEQTCQLVLDQPYYQQQLQQQQQQQPPHITAHRSIDNDNDSTIHKTPSHNNNNNNNNSYCSESRDIIDIPRPPTNMRLVYDKEWSSNKMKGGFSFMS